MYQSNKRLVSRRGFVKSISLAAMSVAVFSTLPRIAGADVPDVLQIKNISQNSMGRVRLEIRHANPSSNHFVDDVEVDVDGQTIQFNLEP